MMAAEQAAALEGQRGKALQTAMRMLTAVGRAYGTRELIPAASAHLGMSITSLGEAGVAMLEGYAREGARFVIPTTTNVLSIERGAMAGTGDARVDLQARAIEAVQRMGALPSYSCNPFSQGNVPRFGQAVAWSESATAPYINAVLGARTNREGATALASALTGLTANYGMHLNAQRRPTHLFEVEAPPRELHEFHLLAASVCKRAGNGVPAISGLDGSMGADELYGLCAAFATYSNGAMFHLVGVTPEAPDLATLFPQGAPAATRIGAAEMRTELDAMRGCDPASAQLVVIGCPHASLTQLRQVRDLLAQGEVRKDCAVFVHSNADVVSAARQDGTLGQLHRSGVQVSSDTCVYVGLRAYPPGTTLVTDSAKMAFLMASRGLRTAVASTADCIAAAVA